MQQGVDGEDDLVALFADDAEYVESFGGSPTIHRGRSAIRDWLRASWDHQPPDIAIEVDQFDVTADGVRVAWTCTSTAFMNASRGLDTYRIQDGLITRLETIIVESPRLR